MAKPVIMSVDDDPEVLNAIERDLRQRYRDTYRVMKAASGQEALDAVRILVSRGTPIALFLSDERMPGMSGTELLTTLRTLAPDSRRVLLTAYSDTDAAIRGINEAGLDHYLLKPWDPPEEQLYPLLDDLLGDWSANSPPSYDGVRVAGAKWSAASYDAKDFLSHNNVPYLWIDIEQSPAIRELVREIAGDEIRLPVVFFPDGNTLVAPTKAELADAVGIHRHVSTQFYDLVIIGAGPAGLAAAVYAGSEGLSTLLIEQHAPGGQAGTTSAIENYLGFPAGIPGADLARRALTQVRKFGVEVLGASEAESVRRQDPFRVAKLGDGTEISCKALILASGVAVRTLDAPGVQALTGRGVYYGAARTEAVTYRGEHICIVGGANSAGQGALFFSRHAASVTMLVRAESLGMSMSRYLVERIEVTPNIEVLTRIAVAGVRGENGLDCVVVEDRDSGEKRDLGVAAMFIFIGAMPRTNMVDGLVELDDKGFVLTGADLMRDGKPLPAWDGHRDPFLYETSVPGIFAVGDLRAGSGKRVAAAVGEGSGAVGVVHRYLEIV